MSFVTMPPLTLSVATAPSRRDDLEAMLNVLIFCVRGTLPWDKATSDSDGASIKARTPLSELCRSLSSNWVDLFQEVRSYSFEQEPNYSHLSNLLQKIAGDFTPNSDYDWSAGATATKSGRKKREVEPELLSSDNEDSSVVSKRKKSPKAAISRRRRGGAAKNKSVEVVDLSLSSDEKPIGSTGRAKTAARRAAATAAPDDSAGSTRRRSSRLTKKTAAGVTTITSPVSCLCELGWVIS